MRFKDLSALNQFDMKVPRSSVSTPIIVIPARLAAARLPGKPLADLDGQPMIVHVWRRAAAAKIGPVLVATDSADIALAVEKAGGEAILTKPSHPSGSDRVFEAVEAFDPHRRHDIVVNLQGDLPLIDPALIAAAAAPLAEPAADIATLAAPLADAAELANPHVVKVGGAALPSGHIEARIFCRIPQRGFPLYHHIGVYAYRRAALEGFVALPPSRRERRDRLEQMRALDNGMRIDVALVDAPVFGVDTAADLDRARALLRLR